MGDEIRSEANSGDSADKKKSKKKKKDKQKKEKGRGVFRGIMNVAWKVLPLFGIKVPKSIKGAAKSVIKGSGVDLPGVPGIGGGGGLGGVSAGDIGKAARTAAQAAAAASVASSIAGSAGSAGTDTVEGVDLETYARATAAFTRASQSGASTDEALAAHGMDMTKYSKVSAGFGALMQKDPALAMRYSQVYQAELG